ncbi:MAG: VOC family protein [Actinomycetota bacterium]|nr:VOC family protein [Actinomycetota bacterium]
MEDRTSGSIDGGNRTAELSGILETALTFDHDVAEETLAFYRETLGLTEVASWREGTVFRLGFGVLLLFDRQLLEENDSPVAQHGSSGVGHICFLAAPDHYEDMRARLEEAGVEIEHDHDWSDERRSFYFRDPADNLLEVANADIWPT